MTLTAAERAIKRAGVQLKQDWFAKACAQHGLPAPVFEYRFDPVRKWRLDAAWPVYRVGLEIQGGIFTQGRHTRGAALMKEMDKLNALAAAGWRVLYRTPRNLLAADTFTLLAQTLYIGRSE